MATALFGSGLWGQDTFGAPTGASFAILNQVSTIVEAAFSVIGTSGNVTNPNALSTLFVNAAFETREGRFDEGNFDANNWSDTESSTATLQTSGAFTSSSFSALETSIGDIRIPGTIEDFRSALAVEGTIALEVASASTTIFMLARIKSRDQTDKDRTRFSDSTLWRAGMRQKGQFTRTRRW